MKSITQRLQLDPSESERRGQIKGREKGDGGAGRGSAVARDWKGGNRKKIRG